MKSLLERVLSWILGINSRIEFPETGLLALGFYSFKTLEINDFYCKV